MYCHHSQWRTSYRTSSTRSASRGTPGCGTATEMTRRCWREGYSFSQSFLRLSSPRFCFVDICNRNYELLCRILMSPKHPPGRMMRLEQLCWRKVRTFPVPRRDWSSWDSLSASPVKSRLTVCWGKGETYTSVWERTRRPWLTSRWSSTSPGRMSGR